MMFYELTLFFFGDDEQTIFFSKGRVISRRYIIQQSLHNHSNTYINNTHGVLEVHMLHKEFTRCTQVRSGAVITVKYTGVNYSLIRHRADDIRRGESPYGHMTIMSSFPFWDRRSKKRACTVNDTEMTVNRGCYKRRISSSGEAEYCHTAFTMREILEWMLLYAGNKFTMYPMVLITLPLLSRRLLSGRACLRLG